MSVYTKTSPPHIRVEKNILSVYWERAFALIPLTLIACLVFQGDAFRLIFTSILGALLAEWGGCVLTNRDFRFWDGSSLFSALVFCLMLPPSVPALFVFSAIFLSVFFTREMFGGLGGHFLDPALFARMTLGLFFLRDASAEVYSVEYNFISRALFSVQNALGNFLSDSFLSFVGNASDFLGTVSGFFIALFGLLLVIKKVQRIEISLLYLLAFFLAQKIFHSVSFQVFLMPKVLFSAFFLFLDPVSTPTSKNGMRLFVLSVAILTGAIVTDEKDYFFIFSIVALSLNILTPWIDHFCHPKPKRKVA